MKRLRYWWGRVLCALGRHYWFNDGQLIYANGFRTTERLVQRCERDDCWHVRFL